MTSVILDDHLLRDLLTDDLSDDLGQLLPGREPATTNLYFHRLQERRLRARRGPQWFMAERAAP